MLMRLLCIVCLLCCGHCFGQQPTCAYSLLQASLKGRDTGAALNVNTGSKVTADESTAYRIPVVFHIVLNSTQMSVLGAPENIRSYIAAQLEVINRDFNAQNSDSSGIPAVFKPLHGNAKVQFELAHTAPDGSASAGYNTYVTTKQGFDFENDITNSVGFSDSKYSNTGGIDAWDPTTYLNVWVINPLDDGKTNTLLGLTIPPSFVARYNIPYVERGITLNYLTWKGMGAPRYRTLTHELGHYFELRHIWGDDDGKCANNGGNDDGIEDTPPQAKETYGCPRFPKYDACSPEGSGIMFMNYMDYTDDACQLMFTKEQVALMRRQLQVYGNSYSLTRHPQVLDYPASTAINYTVSPNPANKLINISFTQTSAGLQSIRLFNAMGQQVYERKVETQQGFYSIDATVFMKGLYLLQLKFTDKQEVHRISVQD